MIKLEIKNGFQELEDSFVDSSEAWKRTIPGRPVLNTFASKANLNVGRLKTLLLSEAEKNNFEVFRDITDIFGHFSSFAQPHST